MITGGSVTFRRCTRPADFEAKEATIQMTFDNKDDLNEAAALAQGKALELVGLKPASAAVQGPSPVATTAKESQPASTPKAEEKLAAPKPPKKSALDLEPDKPQISTQPENRVGPEDITPKAETETKEITDTDLKNKCASKSQKLGGAEKVTNLIKEFGVPRVAELPKEKRADFLAKLEALK